MYPNATRSPLAGGSSSWASSSSSMSKSRLATSRMASCFSLSSFSPVSIRWVGKTSRPGSSSATRNIST